MNYYISLLILKARIWNDICINPDYPHNWDRLANACRMINVQEEKMLGYI